MDQVTGGTGEAYRTNGVRFCFYCGSENLEFLGYEYDEVRKISIKRYLCKDCGKKR